MELIKKILEHPDFKRYMKWNAQAEEDRQFCHHDLEHAIDVARTAYIMSLENEYGLSKEVIYMTALLHDIGKWRQYKDQVDHASESAVLAEQILKDIGVLEEDIPVILDAIKSHRNQGEKSTLLAKIIYDADKSCRLCISCKMLKECKRFKDSKKPELYY